MTARFFVSLKRLVGWYFFSVNGAIELKGVLPIAKNLMNVQHAINHNSSEDSSKDQVLYQKHVTIEVPYLV